MFEVFVLKLMKKVIIKVYEKIKKKMSTVFSLKDIPSKERGKYEMVKVLKLGFTDLYIQDYHITERFAYRLALFLLQKKIKFQFNSILVGFVGQSEIRELIERQEYREGLEDKIDSFKLEVENNYLSENYKQLLEPIPMSHPIRKYYNYKTLNSKKTMSMRIESVNLSASINFLKKDETSESLENFSINKFRKGIKQKNSTRHCEVLLLKLSSPN